MCSSDRSKSVAGTSTDAANAAAAAMFTTAAARADTLPSAGNGGNGGGRCVASASIPTTFWWMRWPTAAPTTAAGLRSLLSCHAEWGSAAGTNSSKSLTNQ